MFKDLFFFGALLPIKFDWLLRFPGKDGYDQDLYAWTSIKEYWGGGIHHSIEMHPCKLSDVPISKAADRIGTMLHDLIYCYIGANACQRCDTCRKYHGDHGRGFQLIAKAMEEQAFRLLGMYVDARRLDSILNDMDAYRGSDDDWGEPLGVSVHDMECYGFLEPTRTESKPRLGRRRCETEESVTGT
jgi:hypothetical protein